MEANFKKDLIERRLAFLLTEVQSSTRENDHVVGYALRVLSNHFTIERSGDSALIKLTNRRISQAANEFLSKCTDEKQWREGTINEHQDPLKRIWSWMCENSETLTTVDIAERIKSYPMVTVTKEEDARLRKVDREFGARSPEERYSIAQIQIIELKEAPKTIIKRQRRSIAAAV